MNDDYNLRGKVAVVGVGETTYYKHGQSPDPEFVLVLKAILAACEDAGINPKEIDGFCSYSNDRNDPPRLANALGIPELRFSNMQWTSGGGGAAAAVQNASRPVRSLRSKWRIPAGEWSSCLHTPLRNDECSPNVRNADHKVYA